MRRLTFQIGELVGIEPGYDTGIWLRSLKEEMDVIEDSRTPSHETVIVLEIKGDAVKVANRRGIIGWTWTNRLQKLD